MADALSLTAGQLNRATLARQMLLSRQSIGVVDAVRALCALQAQSPPSPYIALWNRIADFDAAELDRAYAAHEVVKATLMRTTLHAVAAADYPSFHHAMLEDLRRSKLGDRRVIATGLSGAGADDLISHALAFASRARTNAELEALLTERHGSSTSPGPWWSLRTFAPMIHAPVGGPWSFGERPSYIAAPADAIRGPRERSVATLLHRFLSAFGPASTADFSQFTMIPQAPMRAALDLMADDLVTYRGLDGKPLYDVRGGSVPAEATAAPPRLMAMWDSILLAYRDRSRLIPDAYRKLIIRTNGDTLPTVLVDGHVAGVWRSAPEPARGIEVTAFHELEPATWEGLEAEARALVAFVADRQPDVYRRYGRWWASMPSAEVRILAG